jgi:hypothetical protein
LIRFPAYKPWSKCFLRREGEEGGREEEEERRRRRKRKEGWSD